MSTSLARRWVDGFKADFDRDSEALGELDRLAGDGDFAVNIASALKRARVGLAKLDENASDADVFGAVSLAFLNTGGTSGPLLGMWFRAVGKAFAADARPLHAVATGVAEGTAAVQRLGGAQPGDKTMVDAMVPATSALRAAAERDDTVEGGLRAAALAAHSGTDSTRDTTAQLGRASYVGGASSGVTDPGAALIALFFDAGTRAAAP